MLDSFSANLVALDSGYTPLSQQHCAACCDIASHNQLMTADSIGVDALHVIMEHSEELHLLHQDGVGKLSQCVFCHGYVGRGPRMFLIYHLHCDTTNRPKPPMQSQYCSLCCTMMSR